MPIQLRDYQRITLDALAKAFAQGYKRPCVTAACGAGKTVMFAYLADAMQRNGKTIWFLVHRKELLDQSVETFDRFQIERRTIHIGMVKTVANHLDSLPKPDVIIFDECHFSAAKTWQTIISAFPDAYLVGLTATPVRLDGKPLGEIYDCMVNGPQARELIERGMLAPYRYFAPTVADLSTLKRRGSDYNMEQATDILSTGAVFGDVIRTYRQYADGKKTICYCSSIRHSKSMADAFNQAGITAVHFDGDTPKNERNKIIRDFRSGKITVLCNVDLISVGFDCPDCECCILLRPTMSTALFIQQSCRALRPAPGKTAVILDHVGNYIRHGLPDEPREWTLESGLKKRAEYDSAGRLTVRTCGVCFSAYDGKLKRCPYCGTAAVYTPRERKNFKEIRLQEIRETAKTKPLDQCHTMLELSAYAKHHGYAPGWAYYQAKRRGILR